MQTTYEGDPRIIALGMLVARVVFGTLMAAHGGQKLFGWFRGYGLRGTGEFFESLGFRPGRTLDNQRPVRPAGAKDPPFAHAAEQLDSSRLSVCGLKVPV